MAELGPRIGYLIPEFPGQTHSFFWREILALQARHGYPVRIFSTRMPIRSVMHDWVVNAQAQYLFPLPPASWPLVLGGLLARGGRVLSQPDARRTLRRRQTWPLLVLAGRLGQLCRREGITHLHVHSCANSALIAAFCHLLYGLPYSLVLHGPVEDYGPDQDFKWARARFGFVITEKLRQEMTAMLPSVAGRCRIAPMGVDTDHFSPQPGDRPEGRPFRWFCCARLNRVKGYDVLLDALEAIRRDRPELAWELFVAGEDEQGGQGYRRELEARIARAGLADRVTLLGAVTQQEVLDQLHAADGFVLASWAEPLGVAYMEAMACGVPTIGTAAGGVLELIESGRDGLLVPPKDSPALAAALLRLMREPELRDTLARQGRARIVESFGASRSADALAEALHDFG
ncbi:exopolysaccharide biosynthesis GT4 family glycosyltransferase EpsE [Seohaeicola nanhaiensis]|uniref:Exopolysaccharide biosynthesis GT4 family glycosyltransferase EpsE n=1 Tax=Seohaeicola nanhaiensis TaxID=1387282 RepID=A0ABV9KN54_9RHOB